MLDSQQIFIFFCNNDASWNSIRVKTRLIVIKLRSMKLLIVGLNLVGKAI